MIKGTVHDYIEKTGNIKTNIQISRYTTYEFGFFVSYGEFRKSYCYIDNVYFGFQNTRIIVRT